MKRISTKSRFVKCLAGCIASLLFVSGFFLLLPGINFMSGRGSWIDLAVPFIASSSGIFLLGWVNSRSIRLAALATFAAFTVGIPLAFFLTAPLMKWLIQPLLPSTNLALSGSFTFFWFLLTTVLVIEIITDQALREKRRIGLLLGVAFTITLLLIVESITGRFGQSTDLDILRLPLYAPIVWVIVVLSVNF